jgi:UDP-galactopyranose mutase
MGYKYDYIIIGSGFFGAICAYELNKIGKTVLVLEKRNHIGGNCYTEERDGIHLHKYGPHIFHTSDKEIWDWLNQFTEFNNFSTRPVANYNGEIYSLPFNMWTFNKLWGVVTPEEAKRQIEADKVHFDDPQNLEEQALTTVGKTVYEKLIKHYIVKQWGKDAKELPSSIIKRLPVRFTYDNNYYYDNYQGIPIGGYTQIFEQLLNNIDVRLNIDYLDDPIYWNSLGKQLIYTGPIDQFFNYRFGDLEYKTLEFEFEHHLTNDYQGVFMVSYTDPVTPYTRIIEHKHFEDTGAKTTWIHKEYSVPFSRDKDAYYPVNDKQNNQLYSKYKELADNLPNIYFGGRLAEYKYYDMHQVIKSALTFCGELKQNKHEKHI